MPKIELIYDKDCPNVQAMRQQLRQALTQIGKQLVWQEWDRDDPKSPPHTLQYGSPALLIDGQDISGSTSGFENNNCRLYKDETGKLQKIPSIQMIITAISKTKSNNKAWKKAFSVLPVLGAALLPKLTCPACWPAYTALLAAMGFEFVNYTPYLLPLTILFVIITLILLAYRASSRRGYKPFILGTMASVILIVGKFSFDLDWVMYGGLALLISVSIWNSWPTKRNEKMICSPCPPIISADK